MSLAVIIPVYTPKPDANEQLALAHNLSVLKNRSVVFVYPKGLDLEFYQKLAPQAVFEAFDDSYFKSVMAYNDLMLSTSFYQRFISFEYILILQMDAWVFEDRLDYWMKKDFDYIGAPDAFYKTEPSSWHNRLLGSHLMNGGLSLRKTASMVKALSYYDKWYRKTYEGLEDSFFSGHYSRFWPIRFILKLPDYKTALSFAFEKSPKEEYRRNQDKLPFGCHAYLKFDPDFWKSKGVQIA